MKKSLLPLKITAQTPLHNNSRKHLNAILQPQGRIIAHTILYPALTLGLASGVQASIVHVNDRPITIGEGLSVPWNIDGIGPDELVIDDNDSNTNAFFLDFTHSSGYNFAVSAADDDELLVVLPETVIGPSTSPSK